MKKRKMNYVIHNPNTVDETVNYLLDILIEANAEKVEKAIREAANEEVCTFPCLENSGIL